MKKYFPILLTAVLSAVLLSGCADKTADPPEISQTVTTEEPATEPLLEVDPFKGLNFCFRHAYDGSIINISEDSDCDVKVERKNIYIGKEEKTVDLYSFQNDNLEKLERVGCVPFFYHDPLEDDFKEGDEITVHLLLYNGYSPAVDVNDYANKQFAINFTQTEKKFKPVFNEVSVTEVDPFESLYVYFFFKDSKIISTDTSTSCNGIRIASDHKLNLYFKQSIAEGRDINDLYVNDKVRYSIACSETLPNGETKEYVGDEVNKLMDESWHRLHFTQTEKVFEVKPHNSAGFSRNINVSLDRPDDWQQIISDKSLFDKYDIRHIDGSTATIPITAELCRQFCDASDKDLPFYIDHNTTGDAYENLILGKKDKSIIIVTEPSDQELALAAENGVELEVTPIAYDGFVFITHIDNPVDSLTLEQIQAIYTGEITNWAEVGGYDEEIIPYIRSESSGSQTAMENMVMKGLPIYKHPHITQTMIMAMGDLVERIASYENSPRSIGYSFNYYLNNLYKNDNIKVLRINDVSPDDANLRDGSYPLTSGYYAVTIKGGDPKAEAIKDYLISDEGQELIRYAGYCSIQ